MSCHNQLSPVCYYWRLVPSSINIYNETEYFYLPHFDVFNPLLPAHSFITLPGLDLGQLIFLHVKLLIGIKHDPPKRSNY